MGRNVIVGLIQSTCSDDIQGNFEKTLAKIKDAASQGAQIICTQELFKSLYFCQSEDRDNFVLSEGVGEDSPTVKIISRLAKGLNVVIIASLFEKRAIGIYHNTAVVLDADGSYLGKYRKMHIPDDPHYYEKYYFTPGDLGFQTFKTKYG